MCRLFTGRTMSEYLDLTLRSPFCGQKQRERFRKGKALPATPQTASDICDRATKTGERG